MRTRPTGTRSARARVAATALIALLAAITAPAAAEAAGLRLGIHAQNTLSGEELERMGDGRVDSVRVIFRWSTIQPTADSQYRWSGTDTLLRSAARNGVEVLPVILGTPGWAKDNPGAGPQQGAEAWPTNTAGVTALGRFMTALAQRYGPGGTFFDLHPTTPVEPIRRYQIWNEPNRPLFSPGGDPVAARYADLLTLARAAINGVDRGAKLLLAGMPERTTTSKPLDKYLKKLYRVHKFERLFDVMTLHPYGVDERGAEGAIIRMRRLLKKVGDRKRTLWITEVGWGSGGEPSPFTKSSRKQAKLLRDTAKLLERKRKKYRLGAMYWFSWRDRLDPGGTGQWQDHTGLFKRDGTPKLAWNAFTDVTGGRPGSGPIEESLGLPLSGGRPLTDLLAAEPR